MWIDNIDTPKDLEGPVAGEASIIGPAIGPYANVSQNIPNGPISATFGASVGQPSISITPIELEYTFPGQHVVNLLTVCRISRSSKMSD